MKGAWQSMKPETRQLAIKCAAGVAVAAMLSAVGIIIAIARSGGLDGLYKFLETVI